MHRRSLLATAGLASAHLAAAASPALAHGEDERGPNGGRIADVGNSHVEMVARNGEIRVYVLDGGNRPQTAAGATGSLIVQAGGRQQTVRLEQGEGGAYLVGRGDFQAARGMRVVASLTLPGQPQRQVRYAPMD